MKDINALTQRIKQYDFAFKITTTGSSSTRDILTHKLGITQTMHLNDMDVEVDTRFVPIIEKLNAKGYRTMFCCSGHTLEEDKLAIKNGIPGFNLDHGEYIYIVFDKEFAPDKVPNWITKTVSLQGDDKKPEGFSVVFFKSNKILTSEELSEIYSKINDWIDRLPTKKVTW